MRVFAVSVGAVFSFGLQRPCCCAEFVFLFWWGRGAARRGRGGRARSEGGKSVVPSVCWSSGAQFGVSVVFRRPAKSS